MKYLSWINSLARVTYLLSLFKPVNNASKYLERQIIITNVLSVIFFFVTLGVALIYYGFYGFNSSVILLSIESILFLFIPVINRFHIDWARLMFCIVPIIMTMIITVWFKMSSAHSISYIVYIDSRFILMATLILPVIVFRLQERKFIFTSLGLTACCMLLFDPIHELFGVGYYQMGFNDVAYKYLNYVVCIIFFLISFGILLLREVLERSELDLIQQNHDLTEKQNEIEAQHEELLQHQEEIVASNEKLEEANKTILKQQQALESYNDTLEALVEEKSAELITTNEELVKYNNELIQFSYTVSHNLRGPVARMLGLTRLLKRSTDMNEKHKLEDMVLKSSEELDEILKDLSLIIDIRNDIYRIREKVFLLEEWNKAVSLVGGGVNSIYKLKVDFSDAPYIFGIRPMVQSIFYNLISNAIKYQSPDRKLELEIFSIQLEDQRTLIQISDNGMGIDLKNQKRNLFKLYKRFHPQIAGKGLGLYLVKTQIETLGGTIDVESEVDFGTTFRLYFTEPEMVTRQKFHDSEAVALYYDAHLNVVIVEWKKDATSEEYRDTFQTVLNSLHAYHSPGWISDIRNQGSVKEEDQQWLIENILPELSRRGLKHIAVVGMEDVNKRKYTHRLKQDSSVTGLDIRHFEHMDNALLWMEESLNLRSRKVQV